MTLNLHLISLRTPHSFQAAFKNIHSEKTIRKLAAQAQPNGIHTAVELAEYDATLADELMAALPASLQNYNLSIEVESEDFEEIFNWFLS